MSDLNELKLVFQSIIESTEEFPVNFDDAWQWLGYSRKDSAKRVLESEMTENVDYRVSHSRVENSEGRPSELIMLTTDAFKQFCMGARTEKGVEVRKYYIQLEKDFYDLLKKLKKEPGATIVGRPSFNPLTQQTSNLMVKTEQLAELQTKWNSLRDEVEGFSLQASLKNFELIKVEKEITDLIREIKTIEVVKTIEVLKDRNLPDAATMPGGAYITSFSLDNETKQILESIPENMRSKQVCALIRSLSNN